MSVDVRAEVLIERPREKVAEIMFNPKCDKIWMTGLTRVFPQTAGNYTKGAKVEHIGDFLGRRFSRIALVTRDEPNSFLEFSADEPFSMKIRYELKDVEKGTKVKIQVQSVAVLEFPMPAAIVSKATQEKIDADLKKLKKHLEENTN
jgi:carbon monoxide dehydrogenase subunit G